MTWFYRLIAFAVWIQAVIMTLLPLLGQLSDKLIHWIRQGELLAWMPPAWFLSLALAGHITQMDSPGWQAHLAVAISVCAIAGGFRGFSEDYLLKAADLVRGQSKPASAGRNGGQI